MRAADTCRPHPFYLIKGECVIKIMVYGRPDRVCMKCRATKAWLTRRGIPFSYVNVDKDPASADMIKELGYLEVPVVVWIDGPKGEDGGSWSGHRVNELAELAARLAPADSA